MDFNFDDNFDVYEALERIEKQLFILQQFSLTKEQEKYFEFIKERLKDGQDAENALLEIEYIIKKIDTP